jgi:hypothetical protein
VKEENGLRVSTVTPHGLGVNGSITVSKTIGIGSNPLARAIRNPLILRGFCFLRKIFKKKSLKLIIIWIFFRSIAYRKTINPLFRKYDKIRVCRIAFR